MHLYVQTQQVFCVYLFLIHINMCRIFTSTVVVHAQYIPDSNKHILAGQEII